MLKAVFFDAAGTLIYLPRSVGDHYREVGLRFGVDLEAAALNLAFKQAWKAAGSRPAQKVARDDDDKGWWRRLVHQVLRQTCAPERWASFDFAGYFEAVYEHFAQPEVWSVFDDVHPTLQALRRRGLRLGVISNFDRRLYPIFEGLGLSAYFKSMIISSEVGTDKPDPFIFQTALESLQVDAASAIHVGDDPDKDWGAEAVGLRIFRLRRPEAGLTALLEEVRFDGTP